MNQFITDNPSSNTASRNTLSTFHHPESTLENIPGSEDDAEGETETEDEEKGTDNYDSTESEETEYDESEEEHNEWMDNTSDDGKGVNDNIGQSGQLNEDWPPQGATPARELLPPREGKIFKSKELGQRYLEAVAKHQGYAIAIRSNKGPHLESRYFYCVRGHQNPKRASGVAKVKVQPLNGHEKDLKKPRKSSTSKSDCRFGVSLNYWTKQGHWKVKVQHSRHNHKPYKRPSDLPRLRRLKDTEETLMNTLTEANLSSTNARYIQSKSSLSKKGT
ncbi:uncharacterized protein MELLADRAFT_95072 [Melampsora larici-populina 98AG31]|uniref:FAR1 domain-containing protein n=1 Tax=Melampsora larici-populina (strain 98AG31 / pathotype 3-4-7) TaxID=747676 RepID=F4S907_MELLP|nr:uncharacterized protein MELLADRAFT_95072 [Melampsora larici-populina 98AG31]EGF98831.1 hypothetical protein MELLADRAFT_95072 [Melampsora larici-populina 98AG31]